MQKLITVEIKKPLYGTFLYIREKTIDQALRFGAFLEVKIPQGTAIVDPKEWLKDAKKMEKVFKIAEVPMVLWGNTLKIPGYEEKQYKKKEEIDDKQLKLL